MQTVSVLKTHEKIANELQAVKGTRIVTITMKSEPKLVKPKSNPLAGRVVKFQAINGVAGFDYQAAVNRRREKEGKAADFTSSPSWFEHIGGCLVRHKKTGQLYAYLMVRSQTPPAYYLDNQRIQLSDIREYLYFPKKSTPKKQGLEQPVKFLTIKLENIQAIKGI